MRRMLYVSFDQPEEVSGRLSVRVDKEKVCTLSNHQAFDGAELPAGRHVVRAVFGPSLRFLPFVRRKVGGTEHAFGAWIVRKYTVPDDMGDWTLSFAFRAPRNGEPGEASFRFQGSYPPPKAEPGGHGRGMSFHTDTGSSLVRILYPPAFPGDVTYSRALELPYTLLGSVSCLAMPGERGTEFGWEFFCEDPSGHPVLIREYYNAPIGTTDPSCLERRHLCRIEAEKPVGIKAEEIRKHLIPAQKRTVYLPISMLPEMRDGAFFSELYRFSHPEGQAAPKPEDHRRAVSIVRDGIHPADTPGPFEFELDDRMTVPEFLRFITGHLPEISPRYDWAVSGGEPCQALGLIAYGDPDRCCVSPDLTLKDLNITEAACRRVMHRS